MNCRHCEAPLKHDFLDLGHAPPSNAYLSAADLNKPEIYYPLRIRVCTNCWLVQTEDYARADSLFSPEYAYFSSASSSWLAHAKHYCETIIQRLKLGPESLVVEVASNDGYLLKNFIAAGIPCLGIEPAVETAKAAEKLGIRVVKEFFGKALGERLAREEGHADLIIGNNVFAHVPEINDFTQGMKAALTGGGTITLEFPHLMRLIAGKQFDTVYHEHFSYLSLSTVIAVFSKAGLRVFDVEELPTHGGSLRIYGCHNEDPRKTRESVSQLLQEEARHGLRDLSTYLTFQAHADRIKNELATFLIEQKSRQKLVIAYGAAAKGNTLLNYAGIRKDLLPFVSDVAPSKQGKYMPGSHIPIVPPEKIRETRPDFVLILPWNIAHEVIGQLAYIRQWGGRFVCAVPKLSVENPGDLWQDASR